MKTENSETKSMANIETRQAQNELMGVFHAFQNANDERLEAIERKVASDILLEEKVDRIDRALSNAQSSLDRLSLVSRRPQASIENLVDTERKNAWTSYMRRGDENAIARIEAKSLSSSVASDGGHVAPPEVQAIIERTLASISPMRRIAAVRPTTSGNFRKPVSTTSAQAGWVAETGARAQTNTPNLELLSFPIGEIYALAAATQTLLDDAAVDIDSWLASEIAQSFAVAEGAAFISGDGTNKPKGLLAYNIVADNVQTYGDLGYVASGAAGAFATANPVDKLVDLTYAPKTPYRANSSFLMNRRTLSQVRKFKDSNGNYIWQPSLVSGQPTTLLGYAVYECEDMPDIAANSHSIAYGDFEKGYLIVDRTDVRVLRDPYSNKPFVLFYVTKRVGGGVQDFSAIKLMKFAAS
ncbi:MAG: phage major capsid protein [Hyphomonadaceae bacterium]|nr:MAG: phage major capsid protein [Hyphomonadaceae bacterium]KAF0183873.1 MAG: phage major capsid protein [Hyphomonadaceae bacterium]